MNDSACKILVIYYSKTGNTKKLAEEIVKGIKEVKDIKCVLKTTSEVTKEDFLTSDGIIAGSPVYFGTMVSELKHVFDKFVGIRKKMGDKIGAAFATSGDESGGKEPTQSGGIVCEHQSSRSRWRRLQRPRPDD